MLKRLTLLLLLVGSLAITLCAGGCANRNDISGTWQGQITLAATGKSLSDLKFILKQSGTEVTGTMVFTKPGMSLPLTGTMKNGTLSLSSPLKNGLAVAITAKMSIWGSLKGEALLDYDAPQIGKKQDKTSLKMTR